MLVICIKITLVINTSLCISKHKTLFPFIMIGCKHLCFIQKVQEQSFMQDRASMSWEYISLKRMKNRWETTTGYSALTYSRGQLHLDTRCMWMYRSCPFHTVSIIRELGGTIAGYNLLEICCIVLLPPKILTNSFVLFNKLPNVPQCKEECICSSQTAWTGH